MVNQDSKPPDRGKQKHRTVKIKLKTIVRKNKYRKIINDTVITINKIMTYAYQFLRMFVLEKYDGTITLDRQFMYNILKSICVNSMIDYKDTDKYKVIYEYYNKNYTKFKFDDVNSKNLSFILQYSSIEMNTCLENNIMNHFKDYINRYINILFLYDQKHKIIEDNKDKDTRTKLLKELYEDIKNIKLDLFTNSKLVKYDGKHTEWLNKTRKLLVPVLEKDNINYYLKKNPTDFINYAIYINKEIEKLGKRNYQVIPQRNNSVPKHITFDHSAIVDLFGDKLVKKIKSKHKKSYIMLHQKKYQKRIFKKLFDMKNNVFRQGEMKFNYQFKTDGISAVLDFVNFRKNKYEKRKKENDDINDNINNKPVTKKEFLKKPKDDENHKQLEKLTNSEIKEIKDNYNIIGLDPGKKSLMTAIDNEGKVFQYNAVQRRHECYHKFAHKIIKKEKEKNNIGEIENTLKSFSSRTLDKTKYLDFIHKKNEVNKKTDYFYHQDKFRNIKFRTYSRTKKSEADLLNNIEKFYKCKNKPILIGFGNWSRDTQMKNFFPTPCKGFRNLIASRFKIVIVDEYKTSITCNETEKEMTKWKYNIGGEIKECHKVLTSIKDTNPKGETISRIFIDRDINGSKNILKITNSWLNKKKRPPVFCRETQQKTKIVGKPKKLDETPAMDLH